MRQELYAVLITLPGGDTLLLPNTAVAEVVSGEGLRAGSGPEWLAGQITYRDAPLPVVRFEPLNGAAVAETTRRTRVTVLNGLSGRLRTGQFALLTRGYPHLVTLNRAALAPLPLQEADRREVILTRVRIANTLAAIPNLDWIEGLLVQEDSAPAGA